MAGWLQEILKHERKHFNYYLQAAMEVTGAARLFLKPLFEKEMQGELEHIRMFGDKIVALGEPPTRESYVFNLGSSAKDMLRHAIKMEREVLQLYHELYPKAEEFNVAYNDMSIVLLLEDNIEHTTKDVEEMEKVLKDF